jgi:imidazolonepropionase-like amidohydrolase
MAKRIHVIRRLLPLLLVGVFPVSSPVDVTAQILDFIEPGPTRQEGEGPFDRLIIRGAIVIDGTGAPPRGPMDIVIEGNRIVDMVGVGAPRVPIDESRRPGGATREIDAHGSFVLPGFIDLHVHTGAPGKTPEAEYIYKLWLGHGITTVRGVALDDGSFFWGLREKERSARNEITAPRMFACMKNPDRVSGWDDPHLLTAEAGRAWARFAEESGADCLKLGRYSEGMMDPPVMEAILDEARELGLGTTAHLHQTGVAQMNALDMARAGLGALTHYYGLFESLYRDHDVQPFPVDYNYADEQHRFGEVASQWNLIHPQGSEEWNALIQAFLDEDFILDPTMTAYLAGRDVMRARNADWHEEYTLPSLWDFYQPSRENHGSYYYDWTTWTEVGWRNFYRVWMAFLDDYKDAGGRVTVSSDAGYIYNLYGFSTIEEMELLQEAGFHPLEVIRGATLHAAEALFEPRGEPIQFGAVRPGLLADLVIVGENPVQNLKVLYGTGHIRLNDETGVAERVGGIRYTIKDGIVYDAVQLREDVKEMVRAQKRARGVASRPGG